MSVVFLTTQVPAAFWILLLVFALVVIFIAVAAYVKSHNFHLDFTQMLLDLSNEVLELDHYSIDNLDDVKNILESSNYSLLKDAGHKLKDDSTRLYQGQWISDPADLFIAEKILNKSQLHYYSMELPIYILTTGILAAVAFLIAGLKSSLDRETIASLALIPLLLCAILSIFLSVNYKRNREELKRSLVYLSDAIKERVPVFRELAGTAALIEAFFKYDRSMSESVEKLTSLLDDLMNYKLAETVSESINTALKSELLPPIIEASNELKNAAVDLNTERNEGLNKIADQYGELISTSLETHLQPFYQELENLATNIYEANKSTEISLSTIDNYKDESLALQERLTNSIQAMNNANETWNINIGKISTSISSLSATSKELTALQTGAENQLVNTVNSLQSSLSSFESKLENFDRQLEKENTNLEKNWQKASSENDELIQKVNELGLLFADQTEALNKQSLDISQEIASLNAGLNASVQNFTSGVNSGVIEVLNNFDSYLAEITNRLSNTTAEINDTVDSWSKEMRYNEKRRQKQANLSEQELLEEREKREQLMDFLIDNSNDSREVKDE